MQRKSKWTIFAFASENEFVSFATDWACPRRLLLTCANSIGRIWGELSEENATSLSLTSKKWLVL
jgi:hypothetical protein